MALYLVPIKHSVKLLYWWFHSLQKFGSGKRFDGFPTVFSGRFTLRALFLQRPVVFRHSSCHWSNDFACSMSDLTTRRHNHRQSPSPPASQHQQQRLTATGQPDAEGTERPESVRLWMPPPLCDWLLSCLLTLAQDPAVSTVTIYMKTKRCSRLHGRCGPCRTVVHFRETYFVSLQGDGNWSNWKQRNSQSAVRPQIRAVSGHVPRSVRTARIDGLCLR
jgi:hypothetical protein